MKPELEDLLRELAPQVLAALVRRYGNFETAEDAVQEALLAAATDWPTGGVPQRPVGWLITVASRRMTDQLRSEQASRRREQQVAVRTPTDAWLAPSADSSSFSASAATGDSDDSLVLFLLGCHPALGQSSQVALTLRAVGGLTTTEIAHAFLVPEATMAQRISRAKQRIRQAGARFDLPEEHVRPERIRSVLHVLYLIFNEGHTATSGRDLVRTGLTREAIRLVRRVHRTLPDDGEVGGLLALMLLTDARRPARTGADGRLIPLAEQDRNIWDRTAINEGTALITDTLSWAPIGPYQLQAAIAAVHAEATTADETDWRQILGLYELLRQLDPSPAVTLNQAVAVAMVHGPGAGLELLEPLRTETGVGRLHRLPAVRAHLLEMAGDREEALSEYHAAARLSTSMPEQRYLRDRLTKLESAGCAGVDRRAGSGRSP